MCFALIGGLALRLLGQPTTSFLAPLVFPNTGNMGLPLCLFAFGREGLVLGVVFYSVTAISQFTVGQWIWSGRVSLRQLLTTPLAYAAVLAALFGLEGVPRGVFILDCSMPAAVFNYMLAEKYGRTPSEVAGLVVLSTLISFLTVPLVLAWVL